MSFSLSTTALASGGSCIADRPRELGVVLVDDGGEGTKVLSEDEEELNELRGVVRVDDDVKLLDARALSFLSTAFSALRRWNASASVMRRSSATR